MKSNNLKLEIFRGQSGLKQIQQHWFDLFNNLKNPIYTQSPIWHQSYVRYLCSNSESCYYFCVYKNNVLVAIFPLEQNNRRFYFFKFKSLGFSEHSHFGLNSFIVADEENVQKLFNFLYASLKSQKNIKWSVIYLERALQGTEVALCTLYDKKLCFQSPANVCDVLSVQDHNNTLEGISKNLKANLKKSRKKLLKSGDVEFKSCKDKIMLPEYFDQFLTVEASGWKGVDGKNSAIKLDKKLHAFYESVLHGFSEKGNMKIDILAINNSPVAVHFSIILGSNVFILKIGYDEKYSKLSPGNLLIEEKLKEYSDNKQLKTINLITDAFWHRLWNPVIIEANNIYNCRSKSVSLCFKFILSLRSIIRCVRKKINNIK